MWPFSRHNPQSLRAPAVVTVQDVLDLQASAELARKKSRAQRRREEKEALKASQAPRMCWKCTYGAIPHVVGSNLVRFTTPDGEPAWAHANPSVCAGVVNAVTSQARETVKGAGSDFLRVSLLRGEGYLRLFIHQLKTGFLSFWRDSNESHGGSNVSQKTHRETV